LVEELTVTVAKRRSVLISLGIIAMALGLTFAPSPVVERQITVVTGSELQQPLQTLLQRFSKSHPNIKVTLKIQGSQDIVNNFIDNKNDFKPTILIPADADFLDELRDRWRSQNSGDPFYGTPRPIAKTLLVGIAWPERGKALFPQAQFDWQRLEQALQAGNWGKLGAPANWGSFDLLITDPTRSSSAQLALYLWIWQKLGTMPSPSALAQPNIEALLAQVKRSVYQPPRSTDILLQEFIARGANNADVALIYESIALSRWQESQTSQGQPYQIFYLPQTVESTATAAVVQRDVDAGTAEAANQFLAFLAQPAQQEVFVQYGFRPATANLNLNQVDGSPWRKNIPGAQAQPTGSILPPPNREVLTELIRQWRRGS
jgi:ABC-type molybdate transport system substrate-binding protein